MKGSKTAKIMTRVTVEEALKRAIRRYQDKPTYEGEQYRKMGRDLTVLMRRIDKADEKWRKFTSIAISLRDETAVLAPSIRRASRVERTIWECAAEQQREMRIWLERFKAELL